MRKRVFGSIFLTAFVTLLLTASLLLIAVHSGLSQDMRGRLANECSYIATVIQDDDWQELERIGRRGYSTEFDEFGVGISCIAVPILRNNGDLYGTVSIVASSSVVHEVQDQSLAPMRALADYVREELL